MHFSARPALTLFAVAFFTGCGDAGTEPGQGAAPLATATPAATPDSRLAAAEEIIESEDFEGRYGAEASLSGGGTLTVTTNVGDDADAEGPKTAICGALGGQYTPEGIDDVRVLGVSRYGNDALIGYC